MNKLILLAVIPSIASAITSEQFASKGPLDLCYVQRNTAGDVRQVIAVRYAKAYRTPLGFRRDVSGDMQPVDEPQSTYPLFGVASYYTDTPEGIPDIRLNLSMRIPGGNGANVVYFSDGARSEAWEGIECGAL